MSIKAKIAAKFASALKSTKATSAAEDTVDLLYKTTFLRINLNQKLAILNQYQPGLA
ncbi:hypothetical protein [Sulfitobacter sediminilitoris]|uniref:hypothetical protein n=1 Tax=Sulfitobacter sediminilitoris TaxID=2698830 RepID=UPI00361EAE1C